MTDKSNELLVLINTEYDKFMAIVNELNPSQLVQPGAIGEWSVKDVLAHLAAWEARLVQRVSGAAENGAGMGTPLYNALVHAANKNKSLSVVRARFTRTHRAVLALAARLPPVERERWAVAFRLNTYSHYKWAARLLRRWAKTSINR